MSDTVRELTEERFRELEGKVFRLELEGAGAFELEVDEVSEMGNERSHPPDERSPFSVVFRGPREPLLPQRIYALDNDEVGRLELFLVPVNRTEKGAYYEAVFT